MSAADHKDSFDRRQVLFQLILNYLIEHPDAKDTVVGILKWWLSSPLIEWGKEQVQEALSSLVGKGWLVKRVLPSSQEIAVFLKTPQNKADPKDD